MDVQIIFILISAIIAIGFFSNYIFKKTKIPDIIWLVIFGYLIGPVFNIINPQTIWSFLPLFSAIALLMILFDTGSRMDIYKLIDESINVISLTVLCFLLSFFTVFVFCFWVLKLDVVLSLLIGSITGGTSSAISIPLSNLLKGKIRNEIGLTLKVESILTDPLVIIVSLVFIQASTISYSIQTLTLLKNVFHMFSTSIVFGLIAGIIWGVIWHKFEKYDYHYMLTLAFLFLLYVVSDFLGGNGAISVFMTGVVLGNIKKIKQMFRLKHTLTGLSKQMKRFNSYITFFIRTFFFSSIGIIIQFENPLYILIGIIITLLIFITRYVSVYIFSLVEKLSRGERILMTFLAPRGLAAAVLASLVYAKYNIPGSEMLVQIVFTVILGTVIMSTLGIAKFERSRKG